MFNFDWFNEMSDLDKYFFILSEGVLILLLIFMIPEVIQNYKKSKNK